MLPALLLLFAQLPYGGITGAASPPPAFVGSCSNVTTSSSTLSCSFNTTGATLIWVGVNYAAGTSCTLSSSPLNTFTATSSFTTGINVKVQGYYAFAPATNSSQSFTLSGCGGTQLDMAVYAFSGSFTATTEGANGAGSNIQTTSWQPGTTGTLSGAPHEVCFSHIGLDGYPGSASAFTINSSFSSPITNGMSPGFLPSGDSYKIALVNTALNPAWNWSGVGSEPAALILCLK